VNLENDSEPRPIKKATVNKCVKQTFKKRYPEFKLDNKAFGSIGYSQKWGFKNKLYILADTGSWRTTTNFLIGIDYPRFCMDVSEFFADRQSHYGCGYGSVEIVEDGTNKGLDLVDALLPHFSKCIKNAFKKCGLEV
jgi:hypothetical protein